MKRHKTSYGYSTLRFGWGEWLFGLALLALVCTSVFFATQPASESDPFECDEGLVLAFAPTPAGSTDVPVDGVGLYVGDCERIGDEALSTVVEALADVTRTQICAEFATGADAEQQVSIGLCGVEDAGDAESDSSDAEIADDGDDAASDEVAEDS